jgi:hypothetical protein
MSRLPTMGALCALAGVALASVSCASAHRNRPATPAPVASRGGSAAWWLGARFTPSDSNVAGLALTQIDSTWVRAQVLSMRMLPSEAAADRALLERRGQGFERSGDFNGDGRPDRALVGVYETRSGEGGRFLLILTRTAAGTWEKAFLAAMPGEARFSILGQSGRQLAWWFCLDCDDGVLVRWREGRYEGVSPLEQRP